MLCLSQDHKDCIDSVFIDYFSHSNDPDERFVIQNAYIPKSKVHDSVGGC